jgi:hypothetical protein
MSLKNPAAVFDVSSTTPDNPFEGMSFPDDRDLRQKAARSAAWPRIA